MKRVPLTRGGALRRLTPMKRTRSAPKHVRKPQNEIPATSRYVVETREQGRCFRCGQPGTDWHHRRGRAVKDDHTHCPCNGILLCRHCHSLTHDQPAESRQSGWIVSRYEAEPGEVSVLRADGVWVFLACE